MSAIGLDSGHIAEHWNALGLCQCPCADCTSRLGRFCFCEDCPCESDDEHAVKAEVDGVSTDRVINLDPVAVMADDVTICQRCWAMVPKQYGESHMAWHGDVQFRGADGESIDPGAFGRLLAEVRRQLRGDTEERSESE